GHDSRDIQSGIVLPHRRFQGRTCRVHAAPRAAVPGPLTAHEGKRMTFDTIKYEVDGRTATITLNRPDALNALSPHMITELRAAYAEAENDDRVWLLIVTGTGRAFCTGADVNAIPGDGKVINERPYLSTYEQWDAPQEGTPPFRTMAKPVLAAINGLCC